MNAGSTVQSRIRLAQLTLEETFLCLLQSIHFTLLLGTQIQVADIHMMNICVSGTGAHIQMRWIDFGLWEVVSNGVNLIRAMEHTMAGNVARVLKCQEWMMMLMQEETAALEHIYDLLPSFFEDALEDLQLKRRSEPNTSLMAKALRWLAHALNTRLFSPHTMTPECMARAEGLLGDIEVTAARHYRQHK